MDVCFRPHRGQACGAFGAHRRQRQVQILCSHSTGVEQERAQRVVRCGRSHLVLDGQMRQKRDNLRFTQRARVLPAVNVDAALDPALIGRFGAVAAWMRRRAARS